MPVMSAVGMRELVWLTKRGAPKSSPPRPVERRLAYQAAAVPRGARLTFPAERHRVQTFTFTIFPLSSTTRTTWRFGFQTRRVLLLAWETLLPNATPRAQA